MQKRITDIIRPEEIEREEEKPVVLEEKPRRKFRKPQVRISLPRAKVSLVIVLVVFFGGGLLAYFTLSRADIGLWPETELLTVNTKLTVDEEARTVNISAAVIPGKIFEREKTTASVFTASGEISNAEEAEGTIRVYNAYSTSAQVLVATTRFVSSEGKVFRTPSKITVPGGHYEGGKLVPGEVDIRVVADEPGPEYNIGPSTFSIPGFAGTDRYTKFYARSFQSMEGGYVEKVPKVQKTDLEEAEETLVKRAKEEAETLLKNELASEEISSEYYFLKDSQHVEILESFSLAKVGDELEDFNYQVKAKAKTLLFLKEDLEKFAREVIISKLPDGMELSSESLSVKYYAETVKLDSGKVVLSLDVSAKIYPEIDYIYLKESLKGKSFLVTKLFLEGQPQLTRVSVKFWPFWVKEVPQDSAKIRFNLNID
ncbi:MAG: hypothetical protein Q8P08_01665 [bacterium]|nr:hypothetical protein [bacterium]